MSPCNTDALSGYLDGALTLNERVELERHLRRCADCASELEELRRIDRVLAEWGSQRLPVPVAAQERITLSVERRRRLPALLAFSRMVPAALGTSVAAVLVMLSVNVGILVQTSSPQIAAPAGHRSQLLREQSRLLSDSRRMSAILYGHEAILAPTLTTHLSQLANVY